MDLALLGKKAIVTGGSRGIGKAIARELALEGVDIAIVARGRENLEATAAQLSSETGRLVFPFIADTAVDTAAKSIVDQAVNALGGVDILVNNAAQPGGQGPAPKLADITTEHFESEMSVKVMGYLRFAREIAPYMVQNGWGRIVNISGLAARRSGSTIGSIRNVAVVAMTKNLADELGPHGINVTVVHPGVTRTEATRPILAKRAENMGISIEEAEKNLAEGISVGRIIDAKEIAYVVAFLCSPKSVALNGDVIAAGGGLSNAIYY